MASITRKIRICLLGEIVLKCYNTRESKSMAKEISTLKNKIEYTRGHDIFNMLETYLMQIHNINISQSKFAKNSRYKEIVRILDVDIDFVNGHGERIL